MTDKHEMPSRWSRMLRPDAPLVFGGLLLVTAVVLALDYRNFGAHVARLSMAPEGTTLVPLSPVRRGESWYEWPSRNDPTRPPPMKFDLMPEGRLLAFGTITPGTAQAFEAELAKRGSYVKTVVLHSPGGSVRDALQMGRLIRRQNYATAVQAGQTCVSSCPLVFAGGVVRHAGEKAKIGVHQVTPVPRPGVSTASAVDATQRVLAECEHFLREMDVDLAVWTYAKQTPSDRLHYFNAAELRQLRLTTPGPPPKADRRRAPRPKI